MELEFNQIALWHLEIDHISEHQTNDLQFLLNQEELQRKEQFFFEKDKKRYVLTRAMVRKLLGQYLKMEPKRIVFEHNEYGRPILSSAQNASGLDFNISHSEGVIVCAFVKMGQIGVDIESLGIKRSMGVAVDFFSPPEVDELYHRPESLQQKCFFNFWTLKEAYIKAIGKGLALPLDSFGFSINTERIQFSDFEGIEKPEDWNFRLINNIDKYQVALAVKFQKPGRPVTLNQQFLHVNAFISGLSG